MSVPIKVRNEIKEKLWAEADRLNWSALSSTDKSRYYTIWTEIGDLGGRLGQYMDPRQVRVYIKDTLLKPYTRETSSNPELALRVLRVPSDTEIFEIFIKPHGRLLSDKRYIVWSKASEWKLTLMALHERAFGRGVPFGAVLTESGARFSTIEERAVVQTAGVKLGIHHIVWLD